MKKYLLLIIMALLGNIFAYAQRYVVNGKDGKIRVVEYHLVDGEWTNVKYAPDIYIENGYEFEAVPPVSKDKIVMEYNGKYYHVVFPEKELKLVDDMGAGEGLGFRNAMRNSFIGDWYLGSSPAKLALLLTIIALVVFIISLFKDDVIPVLRYIFVGSVSCVALIEAGAALSVGQDAYWWVNPDDVGYLVACGTLIPYSIAVVLQIYAIKIYNAMGKFDGAANVVAYILMGAGCVLCIISAVQVVINFLFALFTMLGFMWMLSQKSYSRDSSGKVYESDVLGTREIDKNALNNNGKGN